MLPDSQINEKYHQKAKLQLQILLKQQSMTKAGLQSQNQIGTVNEQHEVIRLNIHYYGHLVANSSDFMQRMIHNLQSMHLKSPKALIKVLKMLLKNVNSFYSPIPEEALNDLASLINTRMTEYLVTMPQAEKQVYRTIENQNKVVKEHLHKSYHVFQESLPIQRLYCLDIFSIFLKHNKTYMENCKARKRLLPSNLICFKLFYVDKRKIDHLQKIMQKQQQYIRYPVDAIINELITLYYIIILRKRIFNVVSKQGKASIPSNRSQYQPNFANFQNRNECSLENQFTLKLNFSHFPFFPPEKDIQQCSYNCKRNTILQITNIIQKPAQNSLQELILVKFRNYITLESVFMICKCLRKGNLKPLIKLLQQSKSYKIRELQKYFANIFVTDYSFQQAFDRFGLSKKYDLTNFEKNQASKQQIYSVLKRVAYYSFQLLSLVTSNLLAIEKHHKKEFLVIKKLIISYKHLKENVPKQEMNLKSNKDDLICNVILITNRYKVKSFVFVRQYMSDERYTKTLKKFFMSVTSKRNFVAVLYEYQLESQIQWRQYYRLISFFDEKFQSSMYITNMIEYSELHLFIFAFIQFQLEQKAQSITRQNFYDIVQEEVAKYLSFIANKNFSWLYEN